MQYLILAICPVLKHADEARRIRKRWRGGAIPRRAIPRGAIPYWREFHALAHDS